MSENTAPQAPFTPPPSYGSTATAAAPRRLTRVREGKMLAGVSTGLARYLDIDPVAVRVGLAVATLFSGLGIVFYLACWVLMPQE